MIKYIVIPARYASTRLPGKPLREICGKTILYMVYEKAMLSNLKDHVIIATDDKRIQDAAIMFDADVVMTSPDCKSGTDRCHDAIKGKDADIIVMKGKLGLDTDAMVYYTMIEGKIVYQK